MRRPELEQKISDYIVTTYKATFTGLLEVHQYDTIYKFVLGVPSYMVPTQIVCDLGNDESFLDYIYEELRTRNYMRLEIYKVVRTNESREEK